MPYFPTYNYVFDDGKTVRIGYEHLALELDQLYEKDFIVERAVEVFAKPVDNSELWWQPHFSGGRGKVLNLQDINPSYPAVTWPNATCTFTADEIDGVVRITPPVLGAYAQQEKYKALVWKSEDYAGKYWNDFFELADGQSTQMNGMDFIFGQGLGDRALIIDIDTDKLDALTISRVVYIAQRELPVGCVPIIRQY
jgi:hypothetical protein